MEWTVTPPTQPGYYWCHHRSLGGVSVLLVSRCEVGDDLFVQCIGSEEDWRLATKWDGAMWQGPIPPPTVAQPAPAG